MAFIILFLFLIFLYSALVIYFVVGLTKLKIKSVSPPSELPFLSVVVACRNEAKNLPPLAETLKNQNYPHEKLEVILVNDHSTDDTIAVLKKINFSDNRFRPLHLVGNESGKKAAIRMGIEHALGEIIATTDADCLVPENWLSGIAGQFIENSLKLLIGGVKMNGTNFFEKLQALEFSSLIGSGAGAAMMGSPFLANGANLAFRKKIFLEMDLKPAYASGDDIFLLQQIKAKYGTKSINFLSEANTVVTTIPQKSFGTFFDQRIRWLSKSSGYSDRQIIVVGLLVFFANISVLAGGLGLFFYYLFLPYFLIGFGLKFLIDFILLFFSVRFLNQKNLLFFSFPLAIFYPVYLFLVSLWTLFKKPEWKGRKL
ncbi:MAG: glycosyltransferase [Bacteroidales bacterium]|nr:glycosyltransferase [Bacteroidales bacterium]